MERIYCDICRKKIEIKKEKYLTIKYDERSYDWDVCDDCLNKFVKQNEYLFKNYGEPF